MKEAVKDDDRIPLAQAAIRLGMNREQLIRRIQNGTLAGGQTLGRFWYVERRAVERAAKERAANK